MESVRNEACAKCGGTEHYGREVKVSGESIDLMPVSFFRSSYLVVRVRGTCGLVEFRLPERFMGKLRETFPRVP